MNSARFTAFAAAMGNTWSARFMTGWKNEVNSRICGVGKRGGESPLRQVGNIRHPLLSGHSSHAWHLWRSLHERDWRGKRRPCHPADGILPCHGKPHSAGNGSRCAGPAAHRTAIPPAFLVYHLRSGRHRQTDWPFGIHRQAFPAGGCP